MSRTGTLVQTLVLSLLAALAVGAGAGLGTASAGGPALTGGTPTNGPSITVGTGCAASCISKALVIPTSTTAKVELATTVPAHLTVSVAKESVAGAGATTGGLTTNQTKTVSISAFSQNKTAWFTGLEPYTTYAITVKATDLKGRINDRHGTFETLAVQTTGQAGPDTIDSGLGCSVQCITRAVFVQPEPLWFTANFEITTGTDAKIQVVVSLDKPVQTAGGPVQHEIVFKQTGAGYSRYLANQIHGLSLATRYHVVVRATDAQGRTAVRQGSFRTVDATAIVTVHKIKVLDDGDKGINRGEVYFRGFIGQTDLWGTGWKKVSSGDLLSVNWTIHTAIGKTTPSLLVTAEECDAVLKKNCLIEAGTGNKDGAAGATLDFGKLFAGDAALPPWYGTGIQAPAGHDAYLVLATGQSEVRFLALVTVDLEVQWPS